jgi:hypothetical protein
MGCAAFTFLGIIILAFNKTNQWALWATFGTALAMLRVASYLAWRNERDSSGRFQKQLLEIEGQRPALRLRQPNAIHIEPDVPFFQRQTGQLLFRADFIRIRFINSPTHPYPNAVAKQVIAKVTFIANGSITREIDGRWPESTQPNTLINNWESTTELLRMDFNIGDERSVDIAFKEIDTADCYMFNNDSYHHDRLRNPQFLLPPGTYKVGVRLLGVWVDETFEFGFVNPGAGKRIQLITPT